jgi:hypothetical protein
VSGFINSIECADVVNNTQITVKTVMRLIKNKMTEQDNESFCLLKHVINPRSPRTAKLEVGFPTARNSFPALFWTLLITLCCLVPHIPLG